MTETTLPLTGAGSLPFVDEQRACDFIRRIAPELPFVPQLPRLGKFDEMLYEPFQPFPEAIGSDRSLRKGSLEDIRERIATEIRPRHLVERFANAFSAESYPQVKCQLCGPFTILSQLRYVGTPLIADPATKAFGFELLRSLLTSELALLTPKRAEVIYCLDDPSLPFLKKKEVLGAAAVFRELVSAIRKAGGVPALHCCAPLSGDAAGMLLGELDVDIVSLAFTPGTSFAESVSLPFLRNHLEQGRRGIWGIVPTRGENSAESISRWFRAEWERSGFPERGYLGTGAVSLECGTGTLSEERSAALFSKAEEVRNLLLA